MAQRCMICDRTDFSDWHSYNAHYKAAHGVDMDTQQMKTIIAKPKKDVSRITAAFERKMASFIIDSDTIPAPRVDPWDHMLSCLDLIDKNLDVLERELFGNASTESALEPEIKVPAWEIERFPR